MLKFPPADNRVSGFGKSLQKECLLTIPITSFHQRMTSRQGAGKWREHDHGRESESQPPPPAHHFHILLMP